MKELRDASVGAADWRMIRVRSRVESWVDWYKEKLCKIVYGTQFPKSHILILFLTLCIYFLKLYHGGTYSIGLLEAKNEEKLKKIVYPLTRSKINSTILGANFFFFFSNFVYCDCSLNYSKGICKFSEEKKDFLRSLWFFEKIAKGTKSLHPSTQRTVWQ